MRMYDINPNLPRVRLLAVRMVRQGTSIRETARHFGYAHNTVMKWLKKAEKLTRYSRTIPTLSSRPHSHPNRMAEETVQAILEYRRKHRRCAPVLHHLLFRDGYRVSKSSVERVLRRYGCVNHSKWKKWHSYPPRPRPDKPGILVQMDTVWAAERSLYLYTLLDVFSRYAYALAVLHANTHASIHALLNARKSFPFGIGTLQTDHGSEFSKYFTKRCLFEGIEHRHSRVRTPTDNGHLERFNRTIQEECLSRIPDTLVSYRKALPEYLRYYNRKRPHMALAMQSPCEFLTASGHKVLT